MPWLRKKADPDLEGLAKLIREGDRDAPVRFAGRVGEIEEIEALAESAQEGKQGLTHVITAAPGGGKTALLRELAARWAKNHEARPVLLPASAFSDPEEVLRAMFKALNDPAARIFDTQETVTESEHVEGGGDVRVKVPGALELGGGGKASAGSSRTAQRRGLPRSFSQAFDLLEDRKTPVVLLIDEAQAWGADHEIEGRAYSNLLIEAHTNLQRLPLLIVAGGLGDTREVLAARGVSKLKTGMPAALGRLSGKEQRNVAEALFEQFGIRGSEALKAEWAGALTAGTDGWPRHLTNALRGAAEALIAAEGDLERASLTDALASAERYRQQYYSDQIAPFEGMPELLAAAIAMLPEDDGKAKGPGNSVSKAAVKKAVREAYAAHPRLAVEMPEDKVFTKLLHKGLVQDFGQRRYACPIPSFKTYVEAFCAADGFPVAGREPKAPEAASPAPG